VRKKINSRAIKFKGKITNREKETFSNLCKFKMVTILKTISNIVQDQETQKITIQIIYLIKSTSLISLKVFSIPNRQTMKIFKISVRIKKIIKIISRDQMLKDKYKKFNLKV